jgi:hypothetical protein
VNQSCGAVRQSLETGATEDRQVRAHLEGCASCRAHAALLDVLGRLAPGEANEVTVSRIVAALPPAPWQRRRPAAWLPLVAGFALAVFFESRLHLGIYGLAVFTVAFVIRKLPLPFSTVLPSTLPFTPSVSTSVRPSGCLLMFH